MTLAPWTLLVLVLLLLLLVVLVRGFSVEATAWLFDELRRPYR